MKKFSKIFAAIMIITLMVTMAVPAFAAGTETGTITINNAIVGQQYTIYKMADLDSYDAVKGNYTYLVNDYWKTFFLNHSVSVDGTNHINYTNTVVNATSFAADAVAWAEAGTAADSPSVTITADSTTVVFSNLELGYYCIDSSQGAVCGLTNTDPDGSINEKNGVPIIEKFVKEDSTGDWEHTNDDHLGATVYFQVEVTKVAGAINYVVGDNLSAGLTLDPDLASNIQVLFSTTPGAAGTHYTLYVNPGDADAWKATLEGLVGADNAEALKDYDFVVDLDDATVASMVDGAEIIIRYSATLNENAVIGTTGNENEATLVYGNDPMSILEPVRTITYVWDFQVFKYTNASDNTKQPLADAKFSIYETNPETDLTASAMWLRFVETNAAGVDVYEHVHAPADTEGLTQVITTNGTTGKFVIQGLDSDTYYMKEVEAPAGYHMLRSMVVIQIGTIGSYSDYTLDYTVANTVDGYIEVLNSTGVVLPETGALGTILFVSTGAILVMVMGVLMVVKKRMTKVVFTK